jgi:hypothetical protein
MKFAPMAEERMRKDWRKKKGKKDRKTVMRIECETKVTKIRTILTLADARGTQPTGFFLLRFLQSLQSFLVANIVISTESMEIHLRMSFLALLTNEGRPFDRSTNTLHLQSELQSHHVQLWINLLLSGDGVLEERGIASSKLRKHLEVFFRRGAGCGICGEESPVCGSRGISGKDGGSHVKESESEFSGVGQHQRERKQEKECGRLWAIVCASNLSFNLLF